MCECNNCGEKLEDDFSIFIKCEGAKNEKSIEGQDKIENYDKLISEPGFILTTTSLEGLYSNIKILGIVCSESIIATEVISKAWSGFLNGKFERYSNYIKDLRTEVTGDIIEEAKDCGANAIMGIKYDYKSIGDGMILVSATGTAVIAN